MESYPVLAFRKFYGLNTTVSYPRHRWGFPGGSDGKKKKTKNKKTNPPTMWDTYSVGSVPDLGSSPGEGNG